MYVAPEALSGELVTPAADQYSLATIAYFLLSGALPYTAKTPREMFSQLLSQPAIPLNAARPGLRFPTAVESVIMRGLAKDPAKRYASAGALADDLERFLAGEPTEPPGEDARMDPAALERFAEGASLYARGSVGEALAVWREALELDPDNFVIRSQIWAVEHPEHFWPAVDREWQELQLLREGYGKPLP
jgi:hypothetical protein